MAYEEYPKMLTKKDRDGHDCPLYYPPGHPKQGLVVIFENAEEEEAYAPKPKATPKAKKAFDPMKE
jgi:hypothetical protein